MAKEKFNVETHELVPKHIKVSEKEKEELLKKYHISGRELPRMLDTDPAIQKLGTKDGDIVKIIRKSPTAGESIFYRRVTNA